MPTSFSGAEFAKALSEGTLRELIELSGMVKPIDGDQTAVLFSPNAGCESWTTIPVSMIDSVHFLTTARCRDHYHPLVNITLKQPHPENTEANVFAALLRSVSIQIESAQQETVEPPVLAPAKYHLHKSRMQAYNCFCSQNPDEGRNYERIGGPYDTYTQCEEVRRRDNTCTRQ